MKSDAFPEFQSHRLLRNGHAQTLAGIYLPWRRAVYCAVQHEVELPDGDVLVLHDDCPPTWKPGDRIALLMHGLAGCHQSPYMIRISSKLFDRAIRTFRMDMRGCGAGEGLARLPYHAGRSDDVLEVIKHLLRLCPSSSICLVGFSLSGNIALKLLGENPGRLPPELDRAMAVNPSIDLKACVENLDRLANRMYDLHIVRSLDRNVRRLRRLVPGAPVPESYRRPHRLFDFDNRYTAPLAGFENAHEYYFRCSATQFVPRIRVRTLILTSRDDPLVPIAPFEKLNLPESVSLLMTDHGGHLGYIAKHGIDPDRRWLDWRVIDWATSPCDLIAAC